MFQHRSTKTTALVLACTGLFTIVDLASAQRVGTDRSAIPPGGTVSPSKIHPAMQRLLDRSSPGVRVKAWVLFRADKGFETPATREAAILNTQQTYNRHAVERRRLRRTRPGLFDLADVPVPQRYLAGVAMLLT